MKNLLLTITLSTIALFGMAQNTLTINITELKTNKGTVLIELFDANQNSIKQVSASVENGECTVSIKDLPTGNYAVQYYHDQNNNGKLDTGMFGRPEEGYGYSNDARGFMGPADFEDQIFEIQNDLTITLVTI